MPDVTPPRPTISAPERQLKDREAEYQNIKNSLPKEYLESNGFYSTVRQSIINNNAAYLQSKQAAWDRQYAPTQSPLLDAGELERLEDPNAPERALQSLKNKVKQRQSNEQTKSP